MSAFKRLQATKDRLEESGQTEMAQCVYDETMLSVPSVDGDEFSGQSREARMQLRQRIETEAQGKATAVFQAELARGQAMLQYQIELRHKSNKKK